MHRSSHYAPRRLVKDSRQADGGDAQRALLASIVASCDDAIVSSTLDGIVTSWNGAAERLYGYSAEEATGRPLSLLLHSDRGDELGAILRSVREGERVEHFETAWMHKDGNPVQISLTVSPIRDGGKVTGVSAVARDISERKRAETQARTSSEYVRSLIEANLDPLVTISAEGKITDVNEAAVKATGVPRRELIGTDFSNYFTEPERAREGYQQVFAKGFVTDYPLTIRHQDGR
ncbi:MAG: PAS domain S-box protein, partial [Gammaproteobacteria bacterium]|nr:PAS domain S-box protein [Gammaproteobacteria bacterium]